MAVNEIKPPYITFKDVDGSPLESGYVYIGEPGLNAEANPKTVYWDEDKTTPASQPIRTFGGFPVYLGSPSRLFIDGDYSVVVKDRRSQLVQSALQSVANLSDSNAAEYYPDRASAEAATVDENATVLVVQSPSWYTLEYSETVVSDLRTAITTNAGTRFWRPANVISPQHYAENTNPGTTDMSDALDAMAAGVARVPLAGVAYPDFAALYSGPRFGSPITVDFMGEPVGISRPWILGALDTDLDDVFNVGPGAIYGLKLTNGRLAALTGYDATPLATHTHPTEGLVTTIPAYAMVIGTYETTDKKATQENVFYVDGVVVDNTFEIDCNFLCGGIYLTNTNRTMIDAAHIFNMAKSTMGIQTGVSDDVPTANHIGNFNPLTGSPFPVTGAQVKNPELNISRVSVSGRNRQGGISFPSGETDLTMDTTAIGIYTADFHLSAPIITATTRSVEFDMFNNGQFYNAHPWSNSIIYGPDCGNMITSGGYWDFTEIVLYSFGHLFVNCSWGAGSADLRLVSTNVDEDAEGLALSGCRFYNTATIVYDTEGSGTWVLPPARKHVFSGLYSEPGDIVTEQMGDTIRLASDGTFQFSYQGAPSASLAGVSDGSFVVAPFNLAGTELVDDQFRFDQTHTAWRFGRDNAGSNGKGFILRAPDGTDYLVTIDNAGAISTSAV